MLTGTTGFIGSELRPCLQDRGYKVYSLERYVSGRIGKNVSPPENLWFADLRDIYSLTKCIQKIKPDIVIHLGALTSVGYSYRHPQETLETNLLGTVNLAELCMRHIPNFQQFIFASSAEVYGVCNQKLKTESNPRLIPNSPYSVSKYAAEKYLTYMHKAFNFPVTILRFFNSYGRKRDKWFVVEKTIYQMLHEKECLLGDPEPIRDFLYYTDQLEAYQAVLENPKAIGETFNVCSGIGTSIRELADMTAKLTGFDGDIVWRQMPKRPLDIMHLVGSNQKIKRALKIPDPLSLEAGLRKTIECWRNETGEDT